MGPEPPQPSSPAPVTLGRYRVIRRIGAGGMAEVFLAKSTGAEGIEKMLVVKRILPTFARSARFITMFVDEAKVAMRLNHPNIVQVYAFEQVRDEFLLAMEFVDGLDLGRLVSAARKRETRLPFGLAAYLVQEIAKGLDYAHNRKDEHNEPLEIVHRDVSPQNVLLSYDGGVKVADFGIARARLVSEETGVIKGKFTYMSPEQGRGERVDRRSDVYALGILLSELLTARAMYPGQHGLDVLEHVRRGRITLPRAIDPSVPIELEEIVKRATMLDVGRRTPTARELSIALGRWLHEQNEVFDAVVLERFIGSMLPRDGSGNDPSAKDPGVAAESRAATLMSAAVNVGGEVRERRHVVVVAGDVRAAPAHPLSTGKATVRVGDEAARVFGEIAYKSDAVLSWPDGLGGTKFRFTLGLGQATLTDPLNATRLAFDVLEALDGLSADLPVPMSASFGMSRGLVSTVRDTSGRLLRYEPLGAVLVVAECLGSQARAGEVLAAGEMYRLVRRVFAFDADAREVALPGTQPDVPRTVSAYRLRGARTRRELAEAAQDDSAQGLTGRAQERSAIQEAYAETATSGQSAALLVVGELGVGKTALISNVLPALVPSPTVLRVECVFGGLDLPLATLGALLREACIIGEEDTSAKVRDSLAQAVAAAVPESQRTFVQRELEGVVAPSAMDVDVDVVDSDGGEGARPLLRALRTFLSGVGKRGPLLVCIDALEWADGPSLELLGALLRLGVEGPVFFLLASRPDPRVDRVLGGVPKIVLGELALADRTALIGSHLRAQVPSEIEAAIIDRAGGNPFFILELIEALIARGVVRIEGDADDRRAVRVPGVPITLPSTLEGVIAARLSELSDEERVALRWIAAIGPGLTVREMSAMADLALDTSIAALAAHGIVSLHKDNTIAFPSAVVRQVAYETTDSDDRIRMHRRIGERLAGIGRLIAPARLAYHLELAGDREAAANAYLSAARAARTAHSNRDALRLYARALHLIGSDSPRRFELHEAREQILRGLGRREEQKREIEALKAAALATNEPSKLAQALNRSARYELDGGLPDQAKVDLGKALEIARSAQDRGAEVEALRLSSHLGRSQGNMEQALEACELALTRVGTDPSLLAARGSVLTQRAIIMRRLGKIEEAVEAATEAVVIFRRLGIKRNEAFALNALGVCLSALGELEDAVTMLRTSLVLDRQIGDRYHVGRRLSNLGQFHAEMGDADRALVFLERALAVFSAVDDRIARCDALCAMAEILVDARTDLPTAVLRLDLARKLAQSIGDDEGLVHERIVRSALLLAEGHCAEAEVVAREGTRLATQIGSENYGLLASALLVEALALQPGRHSEATEGVADLEARVASRVVIERAERVHLGMARALSALSRSEEAERSVAAGRAIVQDRAGRLRDERSRDRYLASPVAREILG